MFATLAGPLSAKAHTYVIIYNELTRALSHACVQGVVVTGSAADSFSDEPWVVRLRALLAAAAARQQRLLGVCFGCQVLAVALQGVVRAPHPHRSPTAPRPITAATRGMWSTGSELTWSGSHGMLDTMPEARAPALQSGAGAPPCLNVCSDGAPRCTPRTCCDGSRQVLALALGAMQARLPRCMPRLSCEPAGASPGVADRNAGAPAGPHPGMRLEVVRPALKTRGVKQAGLRRGRARGGGHGGGCAEHTVRRRRAGGRAAPVRGGGPAVRRGRAHPGLPGAPGRGGGPAARRGAAGGLGRLPRGGLGARRPRAGRPRCVGPARLAMQGRGRAA